MSESQRGQFQQVRGRTNPPQTEEMPGDEQRGSLAGRAEPHLQRAADRAADRMLGRRPQTTAAGEPASELDVEISEEEVHREVERILNLHAATRSAVTKRAAATLRESYERRLSERSS